MQWTSFFWACVVVCVISLTDLHECQNKGGMNRWHVLQMTGQRCWGWREISNLTQNVSPKFFETWWPSAWIANIFKTAAELWVFRRKPLKSYGGSHVFHFPVQICDLINIHRLLLFSPQWLVLFEKFTSYSFSLYTSFHGNKAVSTEEECTCLPPPAKDLLMNSVKRVTDLGKSYISIIYSLL